MATEWSARSRKVYCQQAGRTYRAMNCYHFNYTAWDAAECIQAQERKLPHERVIVTNGVLYYDAAELRNEDRHDIAATIDAKLKEIIADVMKEYK